jgi:hypothetical protein
MPFITDNALDDLLQYLIDNAEDLHICSQEPTTYTEAVTTYTLGDKQTITVGSQGNRTPNGRKSTVTAITGGDITATGTATHWAIVDVTGTELLATGALASSQAVTSGNTFSLAAFDLGVPDAV